MTSSEEELKDALELAREKTKMFIGGEKGDTRLKRYRHVRTGNEDAVILASALLSLSSDLAALREERDEARIFQADAQDNAMMELNRRREAEADLAAAQKEIERLKDELARCVILTANASGVIKEQK